MFLVVRRMSITHDPDACCSLRLYSVATRGFIKNSCCDQCLSVPYGPANKSVEMLTSCNVRASVQKYMNTARNIYFGTLASSAPTPRRKSLCSSRLVCQVCFVCSSNWPRIGNRPLHDWESGCPIIHGVPKGFVRPALIQIGMHVSVQFRMLQLHSL